MSEEEPILVRLSGEMNATRSLDDPDDARYLMVDTEEEKEYMEWLVEKGRYSLIGLRTKLTGMRLYQDWMEMKSE